MTALLDTPAAFKADPCLLGAEWPKILCIDDDPDIHTTIELRMRSYEVDIEHAYYGMQGVVESLSYSPDLILTDMAMPNGDGRYLVESLRNHPATSDVPVIVLTGMRDPRLKERVLRSGADAYLNKPIHFNDLMGEMVRFIPLNERDYGG